MIAKKSIWTKSMAVIAVIALVITCSFNSSFAADGKVAKVGETEYSTLQEAIDNANGGEVELMKDVTENITVEEKVILDLGTFTLANNGASHTVTVKKGGNLTIEGNGVIDNTVHGKGALVNYGEVVINGGTLTRSKEAGNAPNNSGGNSWYVMDNQGTVTMNNGSVVGTSKFSSLIRNLGGTFNMVGGNLESNFIVLKNDDNGKINMTGGTISTKAAGGSAIQNWGTLNMTGGTLNAVDGALSLYALAWSKDFDAPAANISGNAKLNGDVKIEEDNQYPGIASPSVQFKGGHVSGDVNVGSAGNLEINSGIIDGAVTLKSTGKALITGGTIAGKVSSSGDNKVAVTGGTFNTALDATVKVDSDMQATVTSKGATKVVIGKQAVKDAIANLKDGDKIEFQSVSDDTVIEIPEGVEITNSTGKDMTINGVTVADGKTVTVEKEPVNPSEPNDDGQDTSDKADTADKESESPKTGDDTMVLGYAIIMLAALGLGGTLAVTRRKN